MRDPTDVEQAAKRVEEAWNTLAGSGESVPTGQLWDALWDWVEARRLDRATPEPDPTFTQSFQAEPWARAFIAFVKRNPTIATDEGTVLGWFANAIMRGYDERTRESKKKLLDLAKQIEDLPPAPLKIEVPLPGPSLEDLREKLAAYAHNAWSRWMRYLFSQTEAYLCDCPVEPRPTVIPDRLVERWTRQLNTEFDDLPVHEQASDLAEADKMLAIMRGT